MNAKMIRGLGATIALVAAGCGDGSDGQGRACSPFQACGGDPVGVWEARSMCTERGLGTSSFGAVGLPPECADAGRILGFVPDTTLTLDAAGTLTEAGALQASWEFELGPDCLAALTGGPIAAGEVAGACEQFEQNLGGDDSDFTSVACAVAGGGCSCSSSQSVEVETSSTFVVSGTTLTDGEGTSAELCVQGDELTLQADVPGLGFVTLEYVRAAP